MIDRKALIAAAVSQWGKPYQFGAKWSVINNPNPVGPIDCSGFVRWAYSRIAIEIPDGSTAQHMNSTSESFALPGDLVFLHTPLGINDEHHVGMIYDQYLVIEARGIIKDGVEVGFVMLRPRAEWEARGDYVGVFRPKPVVAIEGA